MEQVKPEDYAESNDFQCEQTLLLLEEFQSKLKWKNDRTDTVLDIGCGPGDFENFIEKIMPKNYKKLVGVDINEEMINYARKNHQKNNISFELMNIEGEVDVQETFDNIVSFFCFHFIDDMQ